MIIYTNKHNLPPYMVKWLLHDNYDYLPNSFSASSMIKPTKQHLLSYQIAQDPDIEVEIDVMDFLARRRGQAIHDAIEKANTVPYTEYSLKAQELLQQKTSTLDMEKRLVVPVLLDGNTINITGKFDVIENDVLRDTKTERIYSYGDEKKIKDRRHQLSLYAWLCVKSGYNPNVNLEYGYIDSVYNDFVQSCVDNPRYPNTPVDSIKIDLIPLKEVSAYIIERVREHFKGIQEPEYLQSLQCSREDLWMKPTVYKYFSKPENVKASKTSTSLQEVTAFKNTKGKGKGIIKTEESKAIACSYCLGRYKCNQYVELAKKGLVE